MSTAHETSPDHSPDDVASHDPKGSPVAGPGDVTELKTAARTAIRATRRARLTSAGAAARSADAAALTEHGMAWLAEHERDSGDAVRCVTAYQEMAAEPPMTAFVQALLDRDIQVLVPITLPEGMLRWRAAQPGRHTNPMTPQRGGVASDDPGGSQGTEALAGVDVAFIPALAIGPNGTRLGQGGGYYDRAIPALRAIRPGVPVVAVVYSGEVGHDVPARDHDIRVDAALTPDGVRHLTDVRATNSFDGCN